MKLIQRADYLAHKATHREYYSQFVTPYVKQTVIRAIGKSAILASTDEHFNDIPLSKWDAIIGWSDFSRVPLATDLGSGAALRACGDYPTPAGIVCIMKEAAKQFKESTDN